MNLAFSIILLFILLDCVTNEKQPCAKGCHVPLHCNCVLPAGKSVNNDCMISNKNLDTIMSSCYKYLVQHFSVSQHFSLQWNVRYHVYLQQHQRLVLSLFLLVLDQQVLQRHNHLNNILFLAGQVTRSKIKTETCIFLSPHSGGQPWHDKYKTLQKFMRKMIRINGLK